MTVDTLAIIVLLLLVVITLLIYIILTQREKYLKEITDTNKKLLDMTNKCSFYIKEYNSAIKTLENFQDKLLEKIDSFNCIEGRIKKDLIYRGKKALVGDYLAISYKNTVEVLKSLGFLVDVVHTPEDLIDKIKYGVKYDIIFTNNIYRAGGSGQECLKKLRSLEGFSIPIVIHTVTKGKKKYFVDEIGFDDYIEKPVTQEKLKPILERLLIKEKQENE